MTQMKFERAHLRAPLKTGLLYQDGDHVFKAATLNISEGGVLLEHLPHIPEVKAFPFMVSLIDFPELSQMSYENLVYLSRMGLERNVVRVKARIVRSFEGLSDIDRIFVTKIGCEFVRADLSVRSVIESYVSRFSKNLVYLLNLFEGKGVSPKQSKILIRQVADILGYSRSMPISELRVKALHDYQSLG